MMTHAMRGEKRVALGELVHAHASNRHPDGSDIGVLVRYQQAVEENRLDMEALVWYGQLIEKTDNSQFVCAYAQAVLKMAAEKPEIWSKMRHRDGVELHEILPMAPGLFAEPPDSLEKQDLKKTRGPRYTDIVPVPADALSILVSMFKSHPDLRAHIEPRLSEQHKHILSLLDKLEQVSPSLR